MALTRPFSKTPAFKNAGQLQHACIGHAPSQTTHQEVVIYSVEKFFEVEVHNPSIAARKVPLRGGHRLMRRPPRTKAVAVVGERWVELRLEDLQHRLLDEPVESGGNA